MTGERCSHTTYDIDGDRCFCPECRRYYDYTDAEKAAVERQVFANVARQLHGPNPQSNLKFEDIWLLYKYAVRYRSIVQSKYEEESQ